MKLIVTTILAASTLVSFSAAAETFAQREARLFAEINNQNTSIDRLLVIQKFGTGATVAAAGEEIDRRVLSFAESASDIAVAPEVIAPEQANTVGGAVRFRRAGIVSYSVNVNNKMIGEAFTYNGAIEAAFDKGYDIGYTDGFGDGYKVGYQDGFRDGYEAGLDD